MILGLCLLAEVWSPLKQCVAQERKSGKSPLLTRGVLVMWSERGANFGGGENELRMSRESCWREDNSNESSMSLLFLVVKSSFRGSAGRLGDSPLWEGVRPSHVAVVKPNRFFNWRIDLEESLQPIIIIRECKETHASCVTIIKRLIWDISTWQVYNHACIYNNSPACSLDHLSGFGFFQLVQLGLSPCM